MDIEKAEHFFSQLIDLAIVKKASDIHIPAKGYACIRIDGELIRINDTPPDSESMAHFIISILKREQVETLESQRDVDFMYVTGHQRFRCNAFFQQRGLSISLRLINDSIFSLEELGLPKICRDLCKQTQGLVLVVGPTGHGKSTTLAAMIDYINTNRAMHIITIEDPVEFIFQDKMSTIEQRELNYDTISFKASLKAAMRQDPDILMVGELRDLDTIKAAITLAETGHLVFATLHTNSAPLAIDRLIDVFPPSQQSQIRLQLSTSLSAIISQRLLRLKHSGRVLAYEVMVATNAIRNMIRDENVHMIPNVIQTSAEAGMISLDKCLANMVLDGIVSYEIANEYAQNEDNLRHLIGIENIVSHDDSEDHDDLIEEDLLEDIENEACSDENTKEDVQTNQGLEQKLEESSVK